MSRGTHALPNACELANRMLTEVRDGFDWHTAEPLSALDRVSAADQLQDAATEILRYCVQDARTQGVTWTAIGDALDTTRQAAQQRFGDQETT